jgi:hypothetical protein
VPHFSKKIVDYNSKGFFKVPLRASILMDPYPAPLLLRESMWMLPYAQGKIDDLHLTDLDSIV